MKAYARSSRMFVKIQFARGWLKMKPIGLTRSFQIRIPQVTAIRSHPEGGSGEPPLPYVELAPGLFFVRWHFRQLRREEAFLFLVQWYAGRRDDLRSHEDDQILLGVLLGIGAKCPADKRNVTNDGNLVFGLLHIFAHQTS